MLVPHTNRRRMWFLYLVQLPVSVLLGYGLARYLWLAGIVGAIVLAWSAWVFVTLFGGRCEVCRTRRMTIAIPQPGVAWQRAWWDPRPPKRSAFRWVCGQHFEIVIREMIYGQLFSRTVPRAASARSSDDPGTPRSSTQE